MINKTTILCVLAMLCLNFSTKAQAPVNNATANTKKVVSNSLPTGEGQGGAPLKVGDKLPETFWQQEHSIYANGQNTKQTLEQYKGKLLILDFWATWCGTCVGKFPITDSLQKENSELKIVLVNSNRKDNAQTLKKFYTENANAKLHPLPTLVADTILKGMFPHKYVPYYVFIDYRGMVMGFASYHFLNREIVAALLQQHQRLINKHRHEN